MYKCNSYTGISVNTVIPNRSVNWSLLSTYQYMFSSDKKQVDSQLNSPNRAKLRMAPSIDLPLRVAIGNQECEYHGLMLFLFGLLYEITALSFLLLLSKNHGYPSVQRFLQVEHSLNN